MIQDKLRNVNLVRVNGVIEILDSSEVVDSVLDLPCSECQEPPRLQLCVSVCECE